MDQTQWSVQDGGNAALTLIQPDQQYSSIAAAAGQGVYAYEVQGLDSSVGGGYVVQLQDGTTTFVSADSVIATSPEVPQIVAPEAKPSTRRQGGSRQSLIAQVNGGSRQEQQTMSLLKSLKQDSSKESSAETHRNQPTSKSSGGSKHHKVSILQSNWPQLQEPAVETTELTEAALQLQMSQQTSVFADGLADVKPGDKVYVSIEGITYEIVTDESGEHYAIEAGHELTQQATEMGSVTSESTGIGLAELATLSAERETIQLINYQSGAGDGSQTVVSQEQGLELVESANGEHLRGTDQQYMDLVQQTQGSTVVADHDAMQVFLVPGENEQGGQSVVVPTSMVDVKPNVQDLFQHDPQFQEMVAKGFDLSNCHFVIQEDGQSNGTVYMATTSSGVAGSFGQDLQQQLVSVINSSGYVTAQGAGGDGMQSIAYVNGSEGGINSGNVLTILADPSALQQHNLAEGQTKMAWSALTPEDFDDGEFDHLRQDLEETLLNSIVAQSFPAVSLPIDRYLCSYRDFINGNKIETLSSVANSTVSKRPQLPKYEPDLFPRSKGSNLQAATSTPMMTVVYTNESGSVIQKVSGRSLLKPTLNPAKRPKDMGAEAGKSSVMSDASMRQLSTKTAKFMMDKEGKIIKRKRRGSDEDSYDDSDGELGADSDPSWKPGTEAPKISLSVDQMNLNATRTRGRGRPRGSGRGAKFVRTDAQRSVESTPSASVFTPIDLNEPHNYQKGDFVIEKRDRYNYDGFPVWKIESGRLLQKYDPFFSDTGVLHKSVSIYSSWSGDVRTNFKAIMVEVITTTGRKCEIIKVLDSYLPKPPDESLENDALMELFTVYLQVLISQAIDVNFFTSIEQGQESYYLGPVEQIDNLLVEAKQAVLTTINWNAKFKGTMEERPFCKVTEPHAELEVPQAACQATVDVALPAIKNVKFYGPHYDRNSLEITKEGKMLTSQDFTVSQLAANNLVTYHGLHHFKFLLYKKCQEEVQFIRQSNHSRAERDILEDCLKNRVFVQQGLRELKKLLENCSIVITVVTKTDETPE